MRYLAGLPVAILVTLSGCNAYVERSQYDSLQKRFDDAQDELKKAREDAAQTKPGRYQVYHEGSEEWRLDTATGGSCMQFAPGAAWKGALAKSLSCECEDEQKAYDASASQDGRKAMMGIMKKYGCFDYLDKLMGEATQKKNSK